MKASTKSKYQELVGDKISIETLERMEKLYSMDNTADFLANVTRAEFDKFMGQLRTIGLEIIDIRDRARIVKIDGG